MDFYTFLTWQNKDGGLRAHPTGFKWTYCINFIKDAKQFELILIDNHSSNNGKLTTAYASLEDALLVAQQHFDAIGNVAKNNGVV